MRPPGLSKSRQRSIKRISVLILDFSLLGKSKRLEMGLLMAAFTRALDNDLNISLALAALFDFVHEGNKHLDAGTLVPAEAAQALNMLAHIDRVLGIHPGDTQVAPPTVIRLAQARLEARRRKDWAEADRLRREVEAQGWIIQDMPDGFKLKRKVSI